MRRGFRCLVSVVRVSNLLMQFVLVVSFIFTWIQPPTSPDVVATFNQLTLPHSSMFCFLRLRTLGRDKVYAMSLVIDSTSLSFLHLDLSRTYRRNTEPLHRLHLLWAQ